MRKDVGDQNMQRLSFYVRFSIFMLNVNAHERDSWSNIFFSFPLQGLLVFAESTGLPISMYFDEPGR